MQKVSIKNQKSNIDKKRKVKLFLEQEKKELELEIQGSLDNTDPLSSSKAAAGKLGNPVSKLLKIIQIYVCLFVFIEITTQIV